MYKEITIEELYNLLREKKEIDFTRKENNDIKTEQLLVTGWFGAKKIDLFNNNYIVIGYYGGHHIGFIDMGCFKEGDEIFSEFKNVLKDWGIEDTVFIEV